MKQLKKSLTVSTIAVCGIGWFAFTNKAIDELKNTPSHELHKLEDLSIGNKIKDGNSKIHKEYERLVEEERLRLEELERQRLERLEKIRLAKIEEVKKLEQQRKLEEERKKKEQQQLQVSRGKSEPANNKDSNWMTFNVSYYGNDCTGCSGITASGINVKNTIYYKGYQVIASDNSILPMGTLIEIETPYGNIRGIIADRGGAIKGYKLDVLVQSEAHSSKLGRHNSKVRIIGKMNIK